MQDEEKDVSVTSAFKPKVLSYYYDLTDGGRVTLNLSQNESASALKCYDYGVDALTDEELIYLKQDKRPGVAINSHHLILHVSHRRRDWW